MRYSRSDKNTVEGVCLLYFVLLARRSEFWRTHKKINNDTSSFTFLLPSSLPPFQIRFRNDFQERFSPFTFFAISDWKRLVDKVEGKSSNQTAKLTGLRKNRKNRWQPVHNDQRVTGSSRLDWTGHSGHQRHQTLTPCNATVLLVTQQMNLVLAYLNR